MTNLPIIAPHDIRQQAADLAKVREQKDAADKIKLDAATKAQANRIIEWDKAMQRAFKGIVPRPTRHRMIMEGLE